MKKIIYIVSTGVLLLIFLLILCPSDPKSSYLSKIQLKMSETAKKLKTYFDEQAVVKRNLNTFDAYEFDVFNNQKWAKLKESHSQDVIVNWANGHHTRNMEKHIENLNAMFIYSPETKIITHTSSFGSGDFTCVTGIMTGGFSKPMPVGNGKFLEPTGKKFSISMCTVGRWKNGVMVEKWLYWDSASYMQQIGLSK